MIIVDSCGWLEWFTDGELADAIIVTVSRAHDCTIISSDSDLKDQPGVKYIPKKGYTT
jgi:predicted nuclease of predicted toxin-antitoxin system